MNVPAEFPRSKLFTVVAEHFTVTEPVCSIHSAVEVCSSVVRVRVCNNNRWTNISPYRSNDTCIFNTMDVFHQHHHSPKSVSHFDYKQIKHTKQEQTNISYILPKFSF